MYQLKMAAVLADMLLTKDRNGRNSRTVTPQGLQYVSTSIVGTVTGAMSAMMLLAFTSVIISTTVKTVGQGKEQETQMSNIMEGSKWLKTRR